VGRLERVVHEPDYAERELIFVRKCTEGARDVLPSQSQADQGKYTAFWTCILRALSEYNRPESSRIYAVAKYCEPTSAEYAS
jgi:hypothetical protein